MKYRIAFAGFSVLFVFATTNAQPVVPLPPPSTTQEDGKKEEAKEEEKKDEDKFFLQKYLEGRPRGKRLADDGWKIYGWTQGSYNYSTAAISNLPVTFIQRANTFSLNQNWLHLEKSIDTEKKEFQLGATVDGILPGTDYPFGMARNLFGSQIARGVVTGFDLYQAYAEMYLPNLGAQGTTLRFGKFNTFLEYETVQGVNSPLISRSYIFQYNPFTHTGAIAITPLDDDWTISNGLVVGNDNWIDRTDQATYIGQLKWAPKDGKTSAMFNVSIGSAVYDDINEFNRYNVFNLQLTHKFTDKITYVLDSTYSYMNNTPGIGASDWYGFANYLLWNLSDKLTSNSRVEFYNDTQGYRTGTAGLYTAVTQGFTYKPVPWLYVMPEVRYDYNNSGTPFEGKKDLFTATLGFIVRW